MALEFTAGMLMRSMDRRSSSDQIDRHIISLASGISYSDLGAMPRRDYNVHLDELRQEIIPETTRVAWDGETEQWRVSLCKCECECDTCFLILVCGTCRCDGVEVQQFRDVLENDMERVNHTTPAGNGFNHPRLVEIVTGAADVRDWRLKRYKTIETAVVWSVDAPLSGTED